MGYESRIFLIEDSEVLKDDAGKTFGKVLAAFELHKTSRRLDIIFNKQAPVYFYLPGYENGPVETDPYGEEPTFCQIEDFINLIEKSKEAGTSYDWPDKVCQAIKILSEGRNNLILVHMGH